MVFQKKTHGVSSIVCTLIISNFLFFLKKHGVKNGVSKPTFHNDVMLIMDISYKYHLRSLTRNLHYVTISGQIIIFHEPRFP